MNLQQIIDKLRTYAAAVMASSEPMPLDREQVAQTYFEIAQEIEFVMKGELGPDAPVKRIKMLVHKNLRMSERKVAAQCVHAALGLYKKNPQDHWSCVILEASTTQFKRAIENHPEGYFVTDAGYTEIPAGSQTVVAWYEEDDGKQGE